MTARNTAGAHGAEASPLSVEGGEDGLPAGESKPYGGGIMAIENLWLRRLGVVALWLVFMPVAYVAIAGLVLICGVVEVVSTIHDEVREAARMFADMTATGFTGTRQAWKRRL